MDRRFRAFVLGWLTAELTQADISAARTGYATAAGESGLDDAAAGRVGSVAAGWALWLRCLTELGELGAADADAIWAAGWTGLQSSGVPKDGLAERARSVLVEALGAGRAGLLADGQTPDDVPPDVRVLGAVADGGLWLLPEAVVTVLADAGLHVGERNLSAAWADAGLLRVRLEGGRRRATTKRAFPGLGRVRVYECVPDLFVDEPVGQPSSTVPSWQSADPSAGETGGGPPAAGGDTGGPDLLDLLAEPAAARARPAARAPAVASPAGGRPARPPTAVPPEGAEDRDVPTLPLPVRPAAPPAPPAAATPSAPPADEPDLEPPRPAGRLQPAQTAPPRPVSTGERFPAVVADLTGLYGPHGRLAVLPDSLDHVGHLAAAAIAVSPSWGGGEPAQIWIGDDLRARLDLPADLPESAQPHPWVERALAEGWQVGRGGHTAELRPWLRIWREGQSGCRVSIVGWQDNPLTADSPASQALADRLCRYAELLTIPWRNSAGVTGLELLRVVRWRARQRSGSRAAVVRTSIPLPDPAFTPGAEIDVHQWGRLPGPDEAGEWLHVYDRSAAYLAAANGAVVGLDVKPDHVDAPDFDPRRAGYWNIRVPGWEHARLPHPLGRPVRAGGTRWVTTPTVRLLHELDLAPHIDEAYLWPRAVSTRYLTQWYELLRDARTAAQQVADTDPWLLAAVKATYTHGVGQMGAGARKPGKGQAADYPLWRPDWRHTIIATARMTFLHHLLQIGEGTGRWPVLADIDAVGYVSADPDPVRAWPGAAARKELAAGPGRFHVTGSIRVADVTADLEKGRISRILERLP